MSYYKMHRGWMDNPVFANEKFTQREAWEWIISNAAFADCTARIGNEVVTLKRGEIAFSIRFVADKWGWSKSAAHRFISRLCVFDMIKKRDSSGTALTTLTVCNYSEYQDEEKGRKQKAGQKRDSSGTKNKEVQVSKKKEINYTNEFEEWWKAYPLAKNKQNAFKLFNSILAKQRATYTDLLEGAKSYAEEEKKKGTEPRFIAHATTWLNGERWNDDYGPRKKTEWDVKLDHWKTGGWLAEWGPPPGQPGCKVPPEYLISQVKERTA